MFTDCQYRSAPVPLKVCQPPLTSPQLQSSIENKAVPLNYCCQVPVHQTRKSESEVMKCVISIVFALQLWFSTVCCCGPR